MKTLRRIYKAYIAAKNKLITTRDLVVLIFFKVFDWSLMITLYAGLLLTLLFLQSVANYLEASQKEEEALYSK